MIRLRYDDRYIVELSRAAVFDDIPYIPQEDLNWVYIFTKSIEQNIVGLLFTAIAKIPEKFKPDEKLFLRWKQKMLETIAITSKQFLEYEKINKCALKKNIPIITLKGAYIRKKYPVPELRTMGDFDILVNNTNINMIKSLLIENGYSISKDLFGITADNANAHWEVFVSMEQEFVYDSDYWNKEIFNNVEFVDGQYTLNPTFFLAHLIIHTGRHYIETGAGIRNLCDIALYIRDNKSKIDFTKLEEICCAQNFVKIYNYILNAVHIWYGVDLSEVNFEKKETDKFIEYFLLNGIFGRHDNVLLRQFSLDERENSKGLKRLFFPPAKTLQNRYKYLRKYPFLLPIAWIQRIIYGKVGKKINFSRMFKDVRGAARYSDERIQWMKELDLVDKH